MTMKQLNASLIALAVGLAAAPADAQTFTFNGSTDNVTPLGTPNGGRCAPLTLVSIAPGAISSTGTSNLGSFTPTASFCTAGPPPTPITSGQFTYTFAAGDTIFGTYTGSITPNPATGAADSTQNYVITGGTGRFTGATGTLTGTSIVRIVPPNTIGQTQLSGSILATAVTTSGSFATATGAPSAATGDYATAYGSFSFAAAERATALGSFAEATAVGAVAVGDDTFASGPASVALGQLATASAPAASALGHNSVASAAGTTAVGVRAGATAANATSLGANAQATFAGSTAIGAGSATTAAAQVSLGGAGSHVRVGDIAASTAAQTAASVGVATVDANGVLGRNTTLLPAVATLQSAQTAMQGQVDNLFDLRDLDRRDMRQGIAAAVAIGQAPMPSAPGKTSYVLNGATFRGEQAIGGSVMHRLSSSTPLAVGASFALAGNKNNTARIGIAGEF